MDINYFDLSGGINLNSTKTELGTHKGQMPWSDSKNIEIYTNKGIIKQKGNTLLFELPEEESITGMHEMESDDIYKLVITTQSGKIYIYDEGHNELTLLNKTLSGTNVKFACFLYGILVATESDAMFYIKNDAEYTIEDCNLKDFDDEYVYPHCIAVYQGRVWAADDSTIYYSALGTYDNFTEPDDAGYINDFYTDTSKITGMHNYKDCLSIYKQDKVYLLQGTSPADFRIIPFADKGTISQNSILNVDNKQYFLSNGIYALEQVGELNQIRLGSSISENIYPEFEKFDDTRLKNTLGVHYQNKHQMWFLFPYKNQQYYKTIWINDYVNKVWYKRILPQNITCICNFHYNILSSDSSGKVYIEDLGTTFDGQNIDFMWKSPFLSLSNVHHRKMIDEFYFVLDDAQDNKFNFYVYKDYDGNCPDDRELIYSRNLTQLIWAKDDEDIDISKWALDENNSPIWTINADIIEKAEICGSCFSIQLCVEGNEIDDNCAIIGLQFREIYNDD